MISIALDGPSGAGKSTLARQLSEALGYRYVDTGAIYRSLTLGLLESDVPFSEINQETLAQFKVTIRYDESGLQRMFLNGKDITTAIRANEVSKMTSKVASIPDVRDFLLEIQRETAENYDVIMDGRDIATVVLPNADIKIFLTASAEERAKRRVKELEERGESVSFDDILLEITGRDHRDINREIAPLRQVETAFLVDTSDMDFQESFQYMLKLIQEELAK
ncbi:MAG: (d)CMP kinase [Eubacteriales bacterium]